MTLSFAMMNSPIQVCTVGLTDASNGGSSHWHKVSVFVQKQSCDAKLQRATIRETEIHSDCAVGV